MHPVGKAVAYCSAGLGVIDDFTALLGWGAGANTRKPTTVEPEVIRTEEGKPGEEPKQEEAKPEGKAAEKAKEEGGAGDLYETPRLAEIKAEPFKPGEGHSLAEFERQIEGQQNGMNDLTVEEFLKNRDAYKKDGRSTEGSKAQENFRKEKVREKADELMRNDPKLTPKEAKAKAKEFYSDQAALHDPDQIAGGHGTNVTGMGDANVNSSIGSQWKTRIEAIDANVREQAKNMTPEQMKNTKLNVHLYP